MMSGSTARSRDWTPTVRGLLLGTLQHNAYHTGQIVHIAQELAK